MYLIVIFKVQVFTLCDAGFLVQCLIAWPPMRELRSLYELIVLVIRLYLNAQLAFSNPFRILTSAQLVFIEYYTRSE
jgi:hypothetical protein